MAKYIHHECPACHNAWDSDSYMNECPYCGSTGYIEQLEGNERIYQDFYYSEEEDDRRIISKVC